MNTNGVHDVNMFHLFNKVALREVRTPGLKLTKLALYH